MRGQLLDKEISNYRSWIIKDAVIAAGCVARTPYLPRQPSFEDSEELENEEIANADRVSSQSPWTKDAHKRFVQLAAVDFSRDFEGVNGNTSKTKLKVYSDIASKLKEEGHARLLDGTRITGEVLMNRWGTIMKDFKVRDHKQIRGCSILLCLPCFITEI